MPDIAAVHTNIPVESNEPGLTSLAGVVGRVAHAIDRILSPGDVAELRHLAPSDPFAPAFFKLMASIVDPDQKLSAEGRTRDIIEHRWASFFQAAATMRGMHNPARKLGNALASAGYTELRLVRLLRARDNTLFKEIRTCAHFLAAKAQTCDLTDLAHLLLVTNTEQAESIRRTVARAYYHLQTQEKKEN